MPILNLACPPEELFNLDGTSSIKTIHECHQSLVLKKPTTLPTETAGDEVDLTHKTGGDSAPHSSLSSSSEDDGGSNDDLCSMTSNSDEEGPSATGGGYLLSATPPHPREGHSGQCRVEMGMAD
jgi:hypothetical protein